MPSARIADTILPHFRFQTVPIGESKMKDQNTQHQARPLARELARELTVEETREISGGRPMRTHATGPNGDDPADPGDYR